MKTPLDIYLQRHSPLSSDLWLHYSRLSARYTDRHAPGADISLGPAHARAANDHAGAADTPGAPVAGGL